ncbi:hypothetical protein H5410_039959 [Solanum commersonii]|uniref:Uncharacterized protein n=1 Tax=Solanum commersonii TaxID=4109 RepID=A0A9J5XNN6_SOLCO|nr:hypothetical protein H5410_039959 [Solanum commersonii]
MTDMLLGQCVIAQRQILEPIDTTGSIHIIGLAGNWTGPDQQDRFYRNRDTLPDLFTGTGSYRNRFYRKFPKVPPGPLVTG